MHVHIMKRLTGLIVFAVMVALVGIPISYSLHTHAPEHDTCVAGHSHAPETPQEWPDGACGLCVFYAYYAPRDAQFFPAFSFVVAAVPGPVQVNALRAGKPRTAFVLDNANRGPPMA